MPSTMNITFTAGLPEDHGQYLFWLWDETVVGRGADGEEGRSPTEVCRGYRERNV